MYVCVVGGGMLVSSRRFQAGSYWIFKKPYLLWTRCPSHISPYDSCIGYDWCEKSDEVTHHLFQEREDALKLRKWSKKHMKFQAYTSRIPLWLLAPKSAGNLWEKGEVIHDLFWRIRRISSHHSSGSNSHFHRFFLISSWNSILVVFK